ncbi:hypothetical protein NDU88_000439 [Pleurodeles waltl]|uniref:Secreted protein n=1 Tax=Pleurodeles waltl TaxID=8319 RepID=A0AAV7LA88_PLEWA|nr:hypothetical protein NDU88_000439 [Pleurodeles waltl]
MGAEFLWLRSLCSVPTFAAPMGNTFVVSPLPLILYRRGCAALGGLRLLQSCRGARNKQQEVWRETGDAVFTTNQKLCLTLPFWGRIPGRDYI